ncbi:MAG: HupE/UreJ family protein [Bacteroidota bacterium]
MNPFVFYISEGYHHILDPGGYDHVLFVIALSAVFLAKDWKKVLLIVIFFTLGHSITLALAVLDILHVKSEYVEFLIPTTILITCLSNIARKDRMAGGNKMQTNYFFALFFGLIHGLGFSSFFQMMVSSQADLTVALVGFDIGLILGQLAIVAVFLAAAFLLVGILNADRRDWRIVISSAVAGIALMLMMETKFW